MENPLYLIDKAGLAQVISDLDGTCCYPEAQHNRQAEARRDGFENACLYVFPDGTGDDSNPKSFKAMCDRNALDHNRVARQIFNSLPRNRQQLVRELLQKVGRYAMAGHSR
jgi:hypothetical protein